VGTRQGLPYVDHANTKLAVQLVPQQQLLLLLNLQ